MSTNSAARGFACTSATLITAVLVTLAGVSSARAAKPDARASAQRSELVTAANAAAFAAVASRRPRLIIVHLDEESVPAAENPGAPVFNGSAPETDTSPSADWERLPAAPQSPAQSPPAAASSAASSSPASAVAASAAQAPPMSPAAATVPGGAAASGAHANDAAALRAPVATAGNVPTATGGGSSTVATSAPAVIGEQQADLGSPPALDLGAIQSGPDLSAISLTDEIKKAETPARSAALRVTEQARLNLAAGRTDDASRDLGRAVSIDPGNPFEYFYLGRVYIARRNYAQALTFLRRAEIGFSGRPDWLGETVGLEGACYEELARMSDAALAYRRALGSAPGNLRARVGYSRLSSYLPVRATADASAAAGPANETLPPPERSAALPAPAEAPAPPPPAPATQQKVEAGRELPAAHARHSQPDPDSQPD